MPRREPVSGQARLTLTIKGKKTKQYVLRFLDPHEDVADPAWRLTQEDGTSYDVHVTAHGPECTCEDFVWCRNHKDPKGCKHVAALRAVGLLRGMHE